MAIPTLVSATTNAAGTQVTTVWSEAVTNVATPTVTCSNRLATFTTLYVSGTGTTSLVWVIISGAVYLNETVTLSAVADTVESSSTATPNGAISAASVTNASTTTVAVACDGAAASMLTNRCMIIRPTETQSTSSGGMKQSWSVQAHPVCCSIQARNSSETFNTGMVDAAFSFDGFFPLSAGIRSKDRVCLITGRNVGGLSGKILECVGPPIDHAGQGAYLYVPLAETKGNG